MTTSTHSHPLSFLWPFALVIGIILCVMGAVVLVFDHIGTFEFVTYFSITLLLVGLGIFISQYRKKNTPTSPVHVSISVGMIILGGLGIYFRQNIADIFNQVIGFMAMMIGVIQLFYAFKLPQKPTLLLLLSIGLIVLGALVFFDFFKTSTDGLDGIFGAFFGLFFIIWAFRNKTKKISPAPDSVG